MYFWGREVKKQASEQKSISILKTESIQEELKKNKPLQEELNMKKISIIIGISLILGASILSESTLAAPYVNQSVTPYVADQGSLTYHGTVPLMYSTYEGKF